MIEQSGGFFVITGPKGKVIEGGEAFAESLKIRFLSNPGEDLLANWSDQDGLTFGNDRAPALHDPALLIIELVGHTAKRERPDGGVDENRHSRAVAAFFRRKAL